jgi:hypothetical protein
MTDLAYCPVWLRPFALHCIAVFWSNSEFSALASGVLLLFACLLRPGPVVIQLLTSHREWAGNGCPLSV